MARLFFSFYLFIALSLVGLAYGLNALFFADEDEVSADTQALAQFVGGLSQLPPAQWHGLLENADLHWQQLPIDTLQLPNQTLPKAGQAALVLYDDDGRQFITPLPDNTLLMVSVAQRKETGPVFALYLGLFFILLGALLALWLWPLWRDLMQLKKAAKSLSQQGELDHIQLGPISPLLPIAQAFNQLSAQVRDLLQRQRELTGAVAHEFRTPLARLKFALQASSNTNFDTQGMTDDVNELERLVQEMLDFTRLASDAPELVLSDVPLKTLALGLSERLRRGHPNATTIEVRGEDIVISADGHFIERALQNLLTNAMRYAKSHICMHIQLTEGQVLLSVEDDGPGIAEADWHKVFRPFYRPDQSRDRQRGGSGLGLAIVERIQHWHKGRCWVEKSALGGARFVLSYPNHSGVDESLTSMDAR